MDRPILVMLKLLRMVSLLLLPMDQAIEAAPDDRRQPVLITVSTVRLSMKQHLLRRGSEHTIDVACE
jgi:hypothetical protein